MSRLRPLLSTLMVVASVSSCGVGSENAGEEQTVSSQTQAMKIDDSKYCLEGEVVHCSLGPPPICSCVPR